MITNVKKTASLVESQNPSGLKTIQARLSDAFALFNDHEFEAAYKVLQEIQTDITYPAAPFDFKHKVEDKALLCEKALRDKPDPYKRWKQIGAKGTLGCFWIGLTIWILSSAIGEQWESLKTSIMPLAPIAERMQLVEGGTFTMGCELKKDVCLERSSPAHRVSLSSFYIGQTEVSFEEYDAFCKAQGRTKPSRIGWWRGKRPVGVSWYDAIEYCNWLSGVSGLENCYTVHKETIDRNNKSTTDSKRWLVVCDFSKNGYRLPTEAEWEYAAKGGNKGQGHLYAGTSIKDSLASYGNFCSTSCTESWKDRSQDDGYDYTAPIGTYRPNELGIYDMSGNVWEWCWDWEEPYKEANQTNPTGALSGENRIIRGGGYMGYPSELLISRRGSNTPDNMGTYHGFRLARTFH